MFQPLNHHPARYGLAALITAPALALLYFFPPDHFGFYPACPIHQATGLLCPGCGGTRALAALVHGQFLLAFSLNPLVVLFGLGLLGYAAFRLCGGRAVRLPDTAVVAALAVCAAFTVLRNMP